MDFDFSDVVQAALEPLEGRGLTLFRKQINLSELVTKRLSGATLEIGGGATIKFPVGCRVVVNLPQRKVGFAPPATAHIGGLMGKVDLHGIEIAPDWKSFKPLLTKMADLIEVEMI
jgi:hypothetical protein